MRRFLAAFALSFALAACIAPGFALAKGGGDLTAGDMAASAAGLDAAGGILQAQTTAISVGSKVHCTLKSSNSYEAEYTVKPTTSGAYNIYSAGSDNAIVNVVNADGKIMNGASRSNDDYFYVQCEMQAGQTYRIRISNNGYDDSFVFGVFRKGQGVPLFSATAVQLTNKARSSELIATCDHDLPNAEWKSSDESVVISNGGESGSVAFGDDIKPSILWWTSEPAALKSGSATMSFLNAKTGAKFGTCSLTCKGIDKYYNMYVCGVQVNDGNMKSIKGEGISGTVSYDPATNTLTLNNATLTRADRSYGWSEDPTCVIGYGGKGVTVPKLSAQALSAQGLAAQGDLSPANYGTLHVKLVGKNKICNLTYGASWTYLILTGAYGIVTPGSISIEGDGSLSITGGNIGTAVQCEGKFSLAEGATLETNVSAGWTVFSNGVVAGQSATIDGTYKAKVRTHTVAVNDTPVYPVGSCVKTKKLVVGSTGKVNAFASCDHKASNYGVLLTYGGSAVVKGKLTAEAYGPIGEEVGVGIGSEGSDDLTAQGAGSTGGTSESGDSNYSSCVLKVQEGGRVTSSGQATALRNITPKLGTGGKAYAGKDSENAFELEPSGILSAHYVRLDVPIRKSVADAKVKVAKATYTGKALKPAVTVKLGGKTLQEGTDYTLAYSNNKKAGKAAKVKVKGINSYKGTATVKFTIAKAANTMSAKAKKKTLSASATTKTTFKASKVFAVKAAKGKVTFKKTKGSKRIAVASNGKVTVKSGLKAGKTYTVKVKVKAAGNSNYKGGTATVALKVKVA